MPAINIDQIIHEIDASSAEDLGIEDVGDYVALDDDDDEVVDKSRHFYTSREREDMSMYSFEDR